MSHQIPSFYCYRAIGTSLGQDAKRAILPQARVAVFDDLKMFAAQLRRLALVIHGEASDPSLMIGTIDPLPDNYVTNLAPGESKFWSGKVVVTNPATMPPLLATLHRMPSLSKAEGTMVFELPYHPVQKDEGPAAFLQVRVIGDITAAQCEVGLWKVIGDETLFITQSTTVTALAHAEVAPLVDRFLAAGGCVHATEWPADSGRKALKAHTWIDR